MDRNTQCTMICLVLLVGVLGGMTLGLIDNPFTTIPDENGTTTTETTTTTTDTTTTTTTVEEDRVFRIFMEFDFTDYPDWNDFDTGHDYDVLVDVEIDGVVVDDDIWLLRPLGAVSGTYHYDYLQSVTLRMTGWEDWSFIASGPPMVDITKITPSPTADDNHYYFDFYNMAEQWDYMTLHVWWVEV